MTKAAARAILKSGDSGSSASARAISDEILPKQTGKKQSVRVLFILNDESVLRESANYLYKKGYLCTFAKSVLDATVKISSFNPNIIFLSWNLNNVTIKKIYSLFTEKLNFSTVIFPEQMLSYSHKQQIKYQYPHSLMPPFRGFTFHAKIQEVLFKQLVFEGGDGSGATRKGIMYVNEKKIAPHAQWKESFKQTPEPGSKKIWESKLTQANGTTTTYFYKGDKPPTYNHQKESWQKESGGVFFIDRDDQSEGQLVVQKSDKVGSFTAEDQAETDRRGFKIVEGSKAPLAQYDQGEIDEAPLMSLTAIGKAPAGSFGSIKNERILEVEEKKRAEQQEQSERDSTEQKQKEKLLEAARQKLLKKHARNVKIAEAIRKKQKNIENGRRKTQLEKERLQKAAKLKKAISALTKAQRAEKVRNQFADLDEAKSQTTFSPQVSVPPAADENHKAEEEVRQARLQKKLKIARRRLELQKQREHTTTRSEAQQKDQEQEKQILEKASKQASREMDLEKKQLSDPIMSQNTETPIQSNAAHSQTQQVEPVSNSSTHTTPLSATSATSTAKPELYHDPDFKVEVLEDLLARSLREATADSLNSPSAVGVFDKSTQVKSTPAWAKLFVSAKYIGYLVCISTATEPESLLFSQIFEKFCAKMHDGSMDILPLSSVLKIDIPALHLPSWLKSFSGPAVTYNGPGRNGIIAFVSLETVPESSLHPAEKMLSISAEEYLTPGLVLTFDLYLHLPLNNRFILYLRSDTVFSPSIMTKFNNFDVKKVYIKVSDKDKFLSYCLLKEILKNKISLEA